MGMDTHTADTAFYFYHQLFLIFDHLWYTQLAVSF